MGDAADVGGEDDLFRGPTACSELEGEGCFALFEG